MFKAAIWWLQSDSAEKATSSQTMWGVICEKTPPGPKHPVMKDNVHFGIIQSWGPEAGQEVEANLADGWFGLQTICWWALRLRLISQAGNIQGSWREEWPSLVKRPPDWGSGGLNLPTQHHHNTLPGTMWTSHFSSLGFGFLLCKMWDSNQILSEEKECPLYQHLTCPSS